LLGMMIRGEVVQMQLMPYIGELRGKDGHVPLWLR